MTKHYIRKDNDIIIDTICSELDMKYSELLNELIDFAIHKYDLGNEELRRRIDKERCRKKTRSVMHDFHFKANYLRRIRSVMDMNTADSLNFDIIRHIVALAENEYNLYDAETKKLLANDIQYISQFKQTRFIQKFMIRNKREVAIGYKETKEEVKDAKEHI